MQQKIEAYLVPFDVAPEQAGQLTKAESSVLAQVPKAYQDSAEVQQLVRYCLTNNQIEQLAEAIALMHRQSASVVIYQPTYNITVDARHWTDKRDCSSTDNTSTYTEVSGHGNTVMAGDGNSSQNGWGWVVCAVVLTIFGVAIGGGK